MQASAPKFARAKPPAAARRPKITEHHGVALSDDYAWLSAENWQEVMRDPGRARARDPRLPRGRERLHRSRPGRHAGAAGDAVCGDEGAHQGGRQLGARARRAVRILLQLRHAAGSIRGCAGGRAAAADETDPARRQRGGRGQALLAARGRRRTAPTTSCSPTAVDDKGSELYTIRIRDLATGQGPARRHPRHPRLPSSGRDDSKTLFYVRLDANHRPLFVYRHVVGTPVEPTMCSSTRKRTSASTSASARRSRPSSSSSTPTTTRRPRST